jgi:hypothetical protein
MKDNVLVQITVSRNNGKIGYKVDCSKDVSGEELAHYLDEILEGICTWKPEVCEETVKSILGTIPDINKKSQDTLKSKNRQN